MIPAPDPMSALMPANQRYRLLAFSATGLCLSILSLLFVNRLAAILGIVSASLVLCCCCCDEPVGSRRVLAAGVVSFVAAGFYAVYILLALVSHWVLSGALDEAPLERLEESSGHDKNFMGYMSPVPSTGLGTSDTSPHPPQSVLIVLTVLTVLLNLLYCIFHIYAGVFFVRLGRFLQSLRLPYDPGYAADFASGYRGPSGAPPFQHGSPVGAPPSGGWVPVDDALGNEPHDVPPHTEGSGDVRADGRAVLATTNVDGSHHV
eukprot:TRINITY_DN15347_c0_g1_i1.p1 TRINITY_DN15347_c0_g1~~TRINITY_DN15347_c0_g1_i1.p1  ORF type:complete len:262 (+),score=26.89 TRINITY_DN15347_c0_g1_i1:59-844(+)